MASRINGVEAKPVRVAPSASALKRQHLPADKTATAEPAAAVQLTGTARDLVALEQSLHLLPAVNEQRVAAVKRRLDSGEYQINPQRIADKLLHLESDLQRGNPREHSSID